MVRAALCLLPPEALPPQGQTGSWVPQDYCLLCYLVVSPSMGRLPSGGVGLLGQGEHMGFLKEQTHGLRKVQAELGGSLAIASQFHVCPGSPKQDRSCRLWGRSHKNRFPPPDTKEASPRWCRRAETNSRVAGANLWCHGNLSLASIVVLATWGMPGEWE